MAQAIEEGNSENPTHPHLRAANNLANEGGVDSASEVMGKIEKVNQNGGNIR